MDSFLDWLVEQLADAHNPWAAHQVWEVALALVTSFVLSTAMTLLYRYSHRGVSYSQDFVHTMIVMGVVVSLVMILIGNNIARAFTLVGAFSIVRFRTAIKEPRDVAFVFLVMAVGMACGVRFVVHAAIATVVFSAVIVLMHKTNLGHRTNREHIVRALLPEGLDPERVFERVFDRYLDRFSMVSLATVRSGTMFEAVYDVSFRNSGQESAFVDQLQAVAEGVKITLTTGLQDFEV